MAKSTDSCRGRACVVAGLLSICFSLMAATPPSVPAWIDIDSQILARTDGAPCNVTFGTNADGRSTDEEIGGTWTLTTMSTGTFLIFR